MPSTPRAVVRAALRHEVPPWVPWHFAFTEEAEAKLHAHYGGSDALEAALGNHLLWVGNETDYFRESRPGHVTDIWGVEWDRTVDRDIGIVSNQVLPEPTLDGFAPPDPLAPHLFADIPEKLARHPDRFRIFAIGFSLYERAWTLRGIENLLVDFLEEPEFVRDLLDRIADWNIAQLHHALDHWEIDCIHFGDDWGQQEGLQMGPEIWREFLKPPLTRMYAAAKERGVFVSIHSCGDVDELFDDLVSMGLDSFNPFQPEVMDVGVLKQRYAGRLAFFGGLSTQRTLPYGSQADVTRETERLLALGAEGGYIFAPAHAVEGDVPLENMLAFIECARRQEGYAPS